MVVCPAVPARRLIAWVLLTTTALAPGVWVVVAAMIEPALLISLTLPDWSRMAVELWLKGEADVALIESGDSVVVWMLDEMLPCCSTSICGYIGLIADLYRGGDAAARAANHRGDGAGGVGTAADELACHVQPGHGGEGPDIERAGGNIGGGVFLGDRLGANGAGVQKAAGRRQRAGG